MKILSQAAFSYTLYEDETGAYVLALVVPASRAACASYEKWVTLSWCQKLVQVFPKRVDHLAKVLLEEEKRQQRLD